MKFKSNKTNSDSLACSVVSTFLRGCFATVPVVVAGVALLSSSSANAYPATYSMILHSTITESKDYAYLKYYDPDAYGSYLNQNGLREIPEIRYSDDIGEYSKTNLELGPVNPEMFINRDFGDMSDGKFELFGNTASVSSDKIEYWYGWDHSWNRSVKSGVLDLNLDSSYRFKHYFALKLNLDSGTGNLYYESTKDRSSLYWTYILGTDIFAYEVPELGIRVGDFSRVPSTTRVDSSTATLPALATLLLGMAFVRFRKSRKR